MVKQRQMIFRLISSFLALIILVLLFSLLVSKNIKLSDLYYESKVFTFLHIFAFQDMLTRLVPALLAIGYGFILFHILKDNPMRQKIMILNAIIVMILPVAIAIFIFFYTMWFTIPLITTFTNTMITIGLLNIVLSFTFKIFKHN